MTSLKWVGPDPEGSEAVPKVPTDLEYRDVVQRSEDIGLADGGSLEGSQIHESGNHKLKTHGTELKLITSQ